MIGVTVFIFQNEPEGQNSFLIHFSGCLRVRFLGGIIHQPSGKRTLFILCGFDLRRYGTTGDPQKNFSES
jgi:hypothetical protein